MTSATVREERIGEVIAASTHEFIAETVELHASPPFGSFVKVIEPHRPTIYALVAYVETGGLDSSRHVFARAQPPHLVDAQVYDEWPELRNVLRTQFTARVVGRIDGSQRIHHWLPPYPASLHYSVFLCKSAEVKAFTQLPTYLAGLLQGPENSEELIAAAVRHAASIRGNDVNYLIQVGRAIARMLAHDYPRLQLILQRIAPKETE